MRRGKGSLEDRGSCSLEFWPGPMAPPPWRWATGQASEPFHVDLKEEAEYDENRLRTSLRFLSTLPYFFTVCCFMLPDNLY
jgi:hypothetical protein